MGNKSWYLFVIALLVAASLMTRLVPSFNKQVPIQVEGAVERSFPPTDSFIVQAETEGTYAVALSSVLENGNFYVVDVQFPLDAKTGTYSLKSSGTTATQYYEKENGVFRRFSKDVNGTLDLQRDGGQISGKINFRAREERRKEWVTVRSEFSFLSTDDVRPVAENVIRFAHPAIITGLILLFGANFLILLYVGSYVNQGGNFLVYLLQSLRANRVFILGWGEPRLRRVMVAWVFVILGIAILWLMLMFSSWQLAVFSAN